jgi:hypothetical protein
MDSIISSTPTFQQAGSRKTTALLKKYLKEKYGIKTSVWSRGSSVTIEYSFGPDCKEVSKELKRMEMGSYDGMYDTYRTKPAAEKGLILDGYRSEEFDYVFVNQNIPLEFWYRLALFFNKKVRYAEIPDLTTFEEFAGGYFPKCFCGCATWYELIARLFSTRNFCTQDPAKIVFKDIISGSSWDYELIYEVDGEEYSTKSPKALVTNIKKATRPEVNGVRIVEYSQRSIAVVGDTYEIRDRLKDIGGVPNNFLKVDGQVTKGWIFSKSKEDDVCNLILQYSLWH